MDAISILMAILDLRHLPHKWHKWLPSNFWGSKFEEQKISEKNLARISKKSGAENTGEHVALNDRY